MPDSNEMQFLKPLTQEEKDLLKYGKLSPTTEGSIHEALSSMPNSDEIQFLKGLLKYGKQSPTTERAMKASLDDPSKNNRPALQLVPRMLLWGVGAVLAFGAKKYAAHNWRKGLPYSELGRAALGHVSLWLDGEDRDPESGLPHLAHAACCIAFLLEYTAYPERYDAFDDRYRRPE